MSPLNSADQALDFLLAVALGLASGLLYCFFCALRSVGKNGRLAVFLQDILFWLFEAVAAFCFLLLRCRGELRGYVFFGLAAGFALFRLAAHGICLKIFRSVLLLLAKIIAPLGAFLAGGAKIFASVLGNFCKRAKKGAKKFQKAKKRLESREQSIV